MASAICSLDREARLDPIRTLAIVRSALGGESFALAGAVALNAWGYGRATADLDLVVPDSVQVKLIADLEAAGFRTLYRSDGYSNHIHSDPSLGRVDFIYVDPDTASRLFAAARESDIAGVPVLVPRPEHLIAMKVHAIRNDPRRRFRDLADIEFLLGLPEVDRESARGYFERAGLLREWDELTTR